MLKWLAVFLIPIAIFGLAGYGAMSFRAPVPAAQYQDCLNAAQKNHTKQTQCKADESLGERTFVDPVAYYTAWLTIFTALLATVGVAQGFLIHDQIKLSRDEFNASHRPELEISFVRRTPENAEIPMGQQAIEAEFTVVNKGTGEAYITGSRFRLEWLYATDIPTPTNLIGDDIIPHRRFLVGATDRIKMSASNPFAEAKGMPNRRLFLMGWIVYRDAAGPNKGSPRTGYFLREFNAGTGLFDDPRIGGGIDWEWNMTQ